MFANRLLVLADALEAHMNNNVFQTKFNLAEWECGTSCCAIGMAAKMPYFQNLGLFMTSYSPVYSYLRHHKEPVLIEKGRQIARGWVTVNILFDIDNSITEYLFDLDKYDDPTDIKEVIRRLREVAKTSSQSDEVFGEVVGEVFDESDVKPDLILTVP